MIEREMRGESDHDTGNICRFIYLLFIILWLWRRALRLSWTKKTNNYIREVVGVTETEGLLVTMKVRKKAKMRTLAEKRKKPS